MNVPTNGVVNKKYSRTNSRNCQIKQISLGVYDKIYIKEVYLLKYYFESHLICKWRYDRQTIPLPYLYIYTSIISTSFLSALDRIRILYHPFFMPFCRVNFKPSRSYFVLKLLAIDFLN